MKRTINELAQYDKKTDDGIELEPKNKIVCITREPDSDDEIQAEYDKLGVQLTEVSRKNRQYLTENLILRQLLAESYENISMLISDNQILQQNDEKRQIEVENLKQQLKVDKVQSDVLRENQEKDRKIKLLEIRNSLLQSELKEEKLHAKKSSEQLIIWKNKLVRNLARTPRNNTSKLKATAKISTVSTGISLRLLAKPKQ